MRISSIIADIIQIINRKHSDLQNLSDDDHAIYLNVARHDLSARHPAAVIGNLPAAKITSGAFHADRIPNLPAGRITTEQFVLARMPRGDDGKVLTAKGGGSNPAYESVAAWTKLGETTLTGVNQVIAVDNLAAKEFLMVIIEGIGTEVADYYNITFNDDTGANYYYSLSVDGGAIATVATAAYLKPWATGSVCGFICNFLITNRAAYTKIVTGQCYRKTDSIVEFNGFWNNVVNQITKVTITTQSYNFLIGSKITVYGRD